MTNTTNNERKTVVKGFWFDADMNKNAFEVETEYTRSDDKARKFAAKALNVNPNMVIVTEYTNEKPEKANYNIEAILMDGYRPLYETEKPETREDETAIKATVYVYSADVFGYNEFDEPIAAHYETYETAQSFTKVDARASVRMEYEGNFNARVVLVNDCQKHEFKVWFIVKNDDLAKFVDKR